MKCSGVVAGLVLAAALVGCQDEPEPKFTDPTETPTSESTETASPTDEPKSPRAEERTFVIAYLEAIEAASTNGNPKPFIQLSVPQCSNCEQFATNVRDAHRDGGYIKGVDWKVVKTMFKGKEGGASLWRANVESAKETWFDGNDEVVNHVPAGINYYELNVTRQRGSLRVADIYYIEP